MESITERELFQKSVQIGMPGRYVLAEYILRLERRIESLEKAVKECYSTAK